MSHEDHPGERTLGDSQDETSLFPLPTTVHNGDQRAPGTLPGAATQPDAPTEALPMNAAFPSPAGENPDALAGVDPFALWAATSGKPPAPEPSTRRPPGQQTKSDPRTRTRPTQQSRRNLIKLLAVGATGLVTVVTVGGISFARAPQHTRQLADDGSISTIPQKEQDKRGDGHGTGGKKGDDDEGKSPHKKPTPTGSPTPRPSPSPTSTQTPPPTPTTPPTMTPTPTGTVIGSTTQATNSAVSFTNPADGQGSLLVRMSNGSFTAFERACTHQGVPVNYDATAGQFHCPAHDAIFSATNGSHLSGPGSGPLPAVSIHVNANGTVTTP